MKIYRWPVTKILIIVIIFLCLAIRPLSLWADSAAGAVQSAWQQANDIGEYQFVTDIIQTTQPLPTLANAGKSSQTERLYMEGEANIASETMALKLWSEGGNTALGQGAIELQVENGRTLGRINNQEWQEVESVTDLFAPNSNPFYFLKTAENISALEPTTENSQTISRYAFDINSDTFARQMRQQFENQLAQDGAPPLPPGSRLEIPRLYADMIGSGELWLSDDGLPIRQIIHLQFPDSSQEQVSVEITTDFTAWGNPTTAAAVTSKATAVLRRTLPGLKEIALQAIPFVLLLMLTIILLLSRRKKLISAIFGISLSLLMVINPLLHANSAYAFNEYQNRALTDPSENTPSHTQQPEAPSLAAAKPLLSVPLQTSTVPTDTIDMFYDDGLDEDNDGISNAQETEFYGTDPRRADSDGDTLDDGIELNELGTNPLNSDSDGDMLPDWAEVQGFVGADARQWYLDPLVGDSGGNGEADGAACMMVDTNSDDIPDTLDCPDTDGDNVPDVYDLDNDGDSVPDTVDSAPFSMVGDPITGLQDQTFQFELGNVTANEPIYADFQLRPTNPDHLWYSLSTLDWPENDLKGQIQSALDTPFKEGQAGDMRLVPMLEIEMSGFPLPLPMTRTQTTLSFSGLVSGTAVFTQQANVELSLSLSDTTTYNTAIYATTCANITATTTPLYDLGSMGDGDTATITATSLAAILANGNHSLQFTNAANETICRTIPNIINGSYTTQMVDLAALQNYGVTVREKDTDSGLYAYVPLTLLYEQAGNSPVAFTGRMFYQPGQADFGAVEQVRMAWMVMARTDRCLPMPADFQTAPHLTEAERVEAWCSDTANWVDTGPSAIHAYYDDWHLTGLSVQRNLGLKTAVVYEDPAYTAAQSDNLDGFNDDNLWSLALGLDVSFIAGRNVDGIRDLTIDDITSRWDKNSNGNPDPDPEIRWYLSPDAFIVETFNYPDASGLAHLAQSDAYDILKTQFTAQATNGGIQDPTLLFLQENRLRSASLDFNDLITPIDSNGITLDIANSQIMPELVIAGMNWVPYQFNGINKSWQPYDLTQYWIDKGADMDAAMEAARPTTGWTAEDVVGASFIARSYYTSVASGLSQIVEIDGLAAELPSRLADAQMQTLLTDDNPYYNIGTTGKAVVNIVGKSIKLLTKTFGTKIFVDGRDSSIGGVFKSPTLLQDTKETLALHEAVVHYSSDQMTPEDIAKMFGIDVDLLNADNQALLKNQARWSDGLGVASSVAGVLGAVAGVIAAGVSPFNAEAGKIFGIVGSSLSFVGSGLDIASLTLKLKVVASLNNLTSIGKIFTHFKGLFKVSAAAAIFFVVGQAISLGILIFTVVASGIMVVSLEFSQMAANFVANVLVGVLLLVIGGVPVLGQLVVAIIALIDALIAVICQLAPPEEGGFVENYICGGISGLMGKVISWLIYDQTPLIRLDHPDRLNMTNFDFTLGMPELGYSAGNELNLTVDVQSALYRNDIDEVTDVSPFIIYRYQFSDANLKATTLTYELIPKADDIHESLSVNSMNDDWQPPTANGFASDSNFIVTRTVSNDGNVLLKTGMNRKHFLRLAEGQAYKVQHCALIPAPIPPAYAPVCVLIDEKDTQHIDLSDMLVFDVFPATLDEFMQLTAVDNNGFAQGWDPRFPVLQDADGDGLISAAFGGPDPADNTPDFDNDGLSDFYEMQQSNSNPQLADSDSDGLCDKQEVQAGTNPNRADSDGDGLLDSEEVFHQDICDGDTDGNRDEWLGGWMFVYAFDGNTPLSTRVIPSPFTVNPDGDTYPDSVERVYGFNPNVPSSGAILDLSSEVDTNIVRPENGTIHYTAELENNLRTNHALGLLDVDFNAAVTDNDVLPFAFNLQPNSSITTSGTITIDSGITQSQQVTMTNRAGALIVDPLQAVDGRSLWLKMNSPSSFADDSLNNWEVSCFGASCPASDAGYKNSGLRFSGSDYVEMPDGLQAIGLTPSGFTIDLWMKPITTTNDINLLHSGGIDWNYDGDLTVQVDGFAEVTATNSGITADQWNHVTWRYDGFNQEHVFFVNGTAVHTQTYDLTDALNQYASDPIRIQEVTGNPAFGATFDEYAIYPFSLAASEVVANGLDRVFYTHAETSFGGTRPTIVLDDSAFHNDITCQTDPTRPYCPDVTAKGMVGNGYLWRNDYMPTHVGPSPNLDLSGNNGNFTIAAWVYPESRNLSRPGYIMGYGQPNDISNVKYSYPTLRTVSTHESDGTISAVDISIGIENEAGTVCRLEVNQGLPPKTLWFHTSVTFDGLHFTVYVNGVPVTIPSNSYTVENVGVADDCQDITPRSETQFYIGGFGEYVENPAAGGMSFGGATYVGALDELQIFNYELSSEEIADIYWDELPILDLRLDEPPASHTFADRSFNGFAADCTPASRCPISGLPGRDNQAVFFDGNDAMSIPANKEQLGMLNSSFTLSAWINPASTSGRDGVIGNRNPGDQPLFFGLDNGLPQFTLGTEAITGTTAVPLNEWTHITARYARDPDPDVDGGDLSLFVNGTFVISTTNVAPLTTENELQLGRNGTEYFHGMIDSVQVYRGALNDADIAALVLQAPVVNLHLNDSFGATSFANSGNPAVTAACSGTACPQTDIKGRVYTGSTLDGIDDSISIPESGNLLDFDRYSISLWVMPTQQKNRYQTLINKEIDSTTAFNLSIAPNSMRVRFSARGNNCVSSALRTSRSALTENNWNHVMLVYDDESAEVRLYINGALDTTRPISGSACHNNAPIQIGNDTSNHPFAGGIDEVVLYHSVLSDRDVAELYNYQQAWFDTRVGHRITIDADDPTVTLNVTAPFLPNQDKILAVSASDPTSKIVSVEYNINSSGWLAATPDVQAWLFNFVPTGSGSYTIDLRATDEAGNIGLSSHVIAVDGEGPVLGPVNVEGIPAVPAPFATNQDAWAVDLSGSVTTIDSSLDAVTVDLFNQSGASISGRITTTVSAGNWQIDYPFPIQPNGVYTVSVQALDLVGNLTVRDAVANVDATPPVAEISYTGPYTATIANGVVLTGTVTENGITSTINTVEIGFHPMDYNDLSSVRILKDNNILHLPLDDNPATITTTEITFLDLSGAQTPAICSSSSCPETAVRGQLGNAVRFDGFDDVLTAYGVAANLTSAAYSFGGWIYPDASGSGDDALIAFGVDAQLPSAVLLYRHTTNQFVYGDSSGEQVSDGTFAPDTWHHVWVTIGADDAATLYVDGQVEATFTTTERPLSTDTFLLGHAWNGSDDRTFAGLLDDIAVYNDSLDTAEIQRHYRGYAPLLRLPLDEDRLADGALVADESRYGNTAVMTQLSDPDKVEYALPGAVGAGAYDFNTAYINITSQPHFDLSHSEFTQMAWVYPRPTGPHITELPIIVGDASSLPQMYPSLSVNDATKLVARMGDGTDLYHYSTGDVLTPNQWNFIATTFDGTTYRFYVDSVLRDETNQFAGVTPYPTTEFSIGHAQNNGAPIATSNLGYLDEVSLYQQTLNAQQIMALYHQGWQPTTLDVAPQPSVWQYPVPDGLRGSYQIQLRTSDTFNQSFGSGDNGRWDGYIDTVITYDLTTHLDGTGSGSVSSAPAGIACGSDCSETYDSGTVVVLTATPDTGSSFMGWSGACTGVGNCVVTMDATQNVTATFTLGTNVLTVLKDGTGSGAVTTVPAGIDCGTDCAELYDFGTVVTLTAVADTGSSFMGWSGVCTGVGDCVVTMDAARTVTATFALGSNVLSVFKDGTGNGAVSSDSAGIACGADCAELHDFGMVVTLTAVPDTGSTFTGWSGACSGTADCVVTMDAARSVTATFTLDRHDLTVTLDGSGSGSVSSVPVGIACGVDCTATYDYGTVVTLTAVADTNTSFMGWSGACTGTTDCTVTMDASQNVTATFTTYSVFLPVVLNNYVSAPDLVVEDVVIMANSLALIIRNVGNSPATDDFWVDMYINPNTPPTDTNQTWETNGGEGLVWGIENPSLAVGEAMTLTLNSPSFFAAYSNFSGNIAASSTVYAQVDSAGWYDYGNVQELYEDNNIFGPIVTSGASTPASMTATGVFSDGFVGIRP